MRMTGTGNLEFGAHHQRVGELPCHPHATGRDGARVSRDEVHETKTDGLHARVCGDVERAVHRRR